MKKVFKYFIIVLFGVILLYAFGPRVTFDEIDFTTSQLNIDIGNVESYVTQKEKSINDIKPDNEARIIWADSTKTKKEFCLIYLHGFSASQEEGDPIHENFAKRYGCNLFLSRLYDHGRLDSNSLKEVTPNDLYKSAEEALEIGKVLGKKVIVMSCSTGGTLDILLAKNHPEIFAHIMYSPNIRIADPSAQLITSPWGKQILDVVMGGEINHVTYKDSAKPYWLEAYHSDGVLALQYLLDNYMEDDYFSSINQPLFLGCYYKNEEEQDNVVSVAAMHEFFKEIKTPPNQKVFKEFANAGRHVISSHIFSEDVENVQNATFDFAENVLGLKPVN